MAKLEITQGSPIIPEGEQPPTEAANNEAPAAVNLSVDGGKGSESPAPVNKAPSGANFKKERSKTSSAFLESLETPQGQTFTVAILSMLVVAVLFLFAITPAVSSINRQLKINRGLRERNAQYDAKLASLVSLAEKNTNYATDLQTFSTMLGESTNQDYIYADMVKFSQKNNLDFRGLSFDIYSPQQQKYENLDINEKLRFQTITLTVYGNVSNVDKLVSDLESSRRIYDVQDIIVTTDEETPTAVSAGITINTIYWEVEE